MSTYVILSPADETSTQVIGPFTSHAAACLVRTRLDAAGGHGEHYRVKTLVDLDTALDALARAG